MAAATSLQCLLLFYHEQDELDELVGGTNSSLWSRLSKEFITEIQALSKLVNRVNNSHCIH